MNRTPLYVFGSVIVLMNLVVLGCYYESSKTQSKRDKTTQHTQQRNITNTLGLIVMPTESGNILSWKADNIGAVQRGYTVFRNQNKIAEIDSSEATFFIDSEGKSTDVYRVQPQNINDVATTDMTYSALLPWDKHYLDIALDKPQGGAINGVYYTYSANDLSVADLTGDGMYEVIVKWYPSNAKDNSHKGMTGNTYLDAYTLKGEKLWRIDLGKNIRSGAHYTQFIAYDFDKNGVAEIAVKTADGTVDGIGNIIGDKDKDYRSQDGYVLAGPEYLTVFEGKTGKALDTVNYIPERGSVASWGDDYGNRVDRFLAGVAYLDGDTPSLVFARGYYTRAVIVAFNWTGSNIETQWVFDSSKESDSALGAGQGAHSLSVGDVDEDGKDEIVYGAATIDDNGRLLYSTELGHGDALHLADIDPDRQGLEIFMVHESPSAYTKSGVEHAIELHDARTGEIIWSYPGDKTDVGRGVTADIDPSYPGMESWASRGGLIAADGTLISSQKPDSTNFVIWWDGDLNRELLDKTRISKWEHKRQRTVTLFDGSEFDVLSNNGTKATPGLSADILGDWREEVIWRTKNSKYLRLFSTTLTTKHRLPSLMSDRQYRTAIAWQNVGYNQPPHPSFFLGSTK